MNPITIRKAVLLAAGNGTRMRELTNDLPQADDRRARQADPAWRSTSHHYEIKLRNYFRPMTVEQLKSEASKLPPNDRFALAEWIEQGEDVRALRREDLIREIQHGLEQADRGELLEADEVFARLRAGQRVGA